MFWVRPPMSVRVLGLAWFLDAVVWAVLPWAAYAWAWHRVFVQGCGSTGACTAKVALLILVGLTAAAGFSVVAVFRHWFSWWRLRRGVLHTNQAGLTMSAIGFLVLLASSIGLWSNGQNEWAMVTAFLCLAPLLALGLWSRAPVQAYGRRTLEAFAPPPA